MTRPLWTRLVVGLAVMSPAAWSQSFLPDATLAIEAIEQQAEVLAADEYAAAIDAEARALAIGSYELSASMIQQRRRTESGRSLDEFEVQLGQSVRLPGKAALDRRIGAHSRSIAALERGETAHEVAHRLLDVWMSWLRAAATEEAAKDQLQSLVTEQASLVRRVELGDAAQLDLDLMTAELAQARATALRVEAATAVARHALVTDFPQLPLPPQAPLLPEPQRLAEALEYWVARIQSDDYELKTVEEMAARQAVIAQRANADRLPDPTIGVRVLNEGGGDERAVGVVFSMPLPGRYRNELARVQRAQARAAQRNVETVRRELTKTSTMKVTLAANAYEHWQAQSHASQSMQAAARRTQRAWELGEIGLAEKLLAARQVRDLTYQELAARADAHEAQLRMRIDAHDLWHAERDVAGR